MIFSFSRFGGSTWVARFLILLSVYFFSAGSALGQSGLTEQTSSGSETTRDRSEGPDLMDVVSSLGKLGADSLRAGLGVESESKTTWNSNQSPRHTVFSFIHGMEAILRQGDTDYQRVEQTLPRGYGPHDPQVLALKEILDRFAPLQPLDFPDTSVENVPVIQSYELFPYGVRHDWIWKSLETPPREKITLVYQTEEERWIFSPQTLTDAPKLLDALYVLSPVYPERKHRDFLQSIFQPIGENTPWWGWLVLGSSFVFASFIFSFIKRGSRTIAKRISEETRPVISSILRSIGTSLGLLAATIVVILGSQFLFFTPTFSDLYWEVIRGVLLIAVLSVFLGFTDLVSTLVKKSFSEKHDAYGAMTVTIVQRVINTTLFVLLVVYILENVFNINVGVLITGLGIIGLALSLAGKETVQNLFGAVSIFTNQPFVVGDWVEFKGNLGEVQDVRMQSTHILLLSGETLVVPNMQFVSNEVENLSMRKFLRREMNLAVPYGTPKDKMEKAIDTLKKVFQQDEIVKEGRFDLEEREASVTFSDFGDYYLNIRVYYWYFIGEKGEKMQRNDSRGWYTYLEHCSQVNQAIIKAFEEADIQFAFPTQSLEILDAKEDRPASSTKSTSSS